MENNNIQEQTAKYYKGDITYLERYIAFCKTHIKSFKEEMKECEETIREIKGEWVKNPNHYHNLLK